MLRFTARPGSGWTSGAFKTGVRDAVIGWLPEQQFSRPHLSPIPHRFKRQDTINLL